MIYLKRTLWLLGYPIIWILASVLLGVASVFIGFEYLYLYIKTGGIDGCNNHLEWSIKLIEWYSDIEPKED